MENLFSLVQVHNVFDEIPHWGCFWFLVPFYIIDVHCCGHWFVAFGMSLDSLFFWVPPCSLAVESPNYTSILQLNFNQEDEMICHVLERCEETDVLVSKK